MLDWEVYAEIEEEAAKRHRAANRGAGGQTITPPNFLDYWVAVVSTERAQKDVADEIERLRAVLSVITARDAYSHDEVVAMARRALESKQ